MKISFHMEMLKNNCNRKIEDIKSSISKDVPSIRVLECEVLDNIYGSDFSEKMNISTIASESSYPYFESADKDPIKSYWDISCKDLLKVLKDQLSSRNL